MASPRAHGHEATNTEMAFSIGLQILQNEWISTLSNSMRNDQIRKTIAEITKITFTNIFKIC